MTTLTTRTSSIYRNAAISSQNIPLNKRSIAVLVGRTAYYAFSRNNPSLPPRRRSFDKAQEWMANWKMFGESLSRYLGVPNDLVVHHQEVCQQDIPADRFSKLVQDTNCAWLDISSHQNYPGYLDLPENINTGIMQEFGSALLHALDDFRVKDDLSSDDPARWCLAFPGTAYYPIIQLGLQAATPAREEVIFEEWEPMGGTTWPWEHPLTVRVALRDLGLLEQVGEDVDFSEEPDIHLRDLLADRLQKDQWKEVYKTAFQLWRRSEE